MSAPGNQITLMPASSVFVVILFLRPARFGDDAPGHYFAAAALRVGWNIPHAKDFAISSRFKFVLLVPLLLSRSCSRSMYVICASRSGSVNSLHFNFVATVASYAAKFGALAGSATAALVLLTE
jgi:hypothetical protein